MIDKEKILREVTRMETLAGNILNLGYNIRQELGDVDPSAPRKGRAKERKKRAENIRMRSIVKTISNRSIIDQ